MAVQAGTCRPGRLGLREGAAAGVVAVAEQAEGGVAAAARC